MPIVFHRFCCTFSTNDHLPRLFFMLPTRFAHSAGWFPTGVPHAVPQVAHGFSGCFRVLPQASQNCVASLFPNCSSILMKLRACNAMGSSWKTRQPWKPTTKAQKSMQNFQPGPVVPWLLGFSGFLVSRLRWLLGFSASVALGFLASVASWLLRTKTTVFPRWLHASTPEFNVSFLLKTLTDITKDHINTRNPNINTKK